MGGEKQYLIKWSGYPESASTWEYEGNVLCEELKKAYEDNKKKLKKEKTQEKKVVKPQKFRIKVTNEWDGVIEKIVGIQRSKSGILEIQYMTFNGNEGICPATELHSKAPVRLLEFYEENLQFPE